MSTLPGVAHNPVLYSRPSAGLSLFMKIVALAQWLASRPRTKPCTTIVLHATAGGSLSGALSTLRIKGLSYHYIIEKDGTITKCCPSNRVAFHAGKSEGPQGDNVNGYSIGISFVNRNDGTDMIPEAQEKAAQELVTELRESFPLHWVTTHWAISPGRKTDPRPMGPGRLMKFAQICGLKAWQG